MHMRVLIHWWDFGRLSRLVLAAWASTCRTAPACVGGPVGGASIDVACNYADFGLRWHKPSLFIVGVPLKDKRRYSRHSV